MELEIRLLGPVEASLDGRAVPLGARKQRALLAMLALEAGHTVTTDRLMRGLWGAHAPDTAPKSVQVYVSRLRKALPDGDSLIVTHGHGYQLAIPPDSVDAYRLERLVTEAARDGEDGRAAEAAIALWRGPPLVDVDGEPFAEREIPRLEELWLRAKELSIDAQLAAGRPEDALAELTPLVAQHPLRERLHWQRMLALYRSGRQADALAAYSEARATLVDEVGVEPSHELKRLQEAILAQDPALADVAPLPAAPVRAPPAVREAGEHAPVRRRPTRIFLAAGAALLAGIVVFLVTRSGEPERLPGVAEDSVAVLATDGQSLHARYAVGRGPTALTAGGGYVWAADELDGTVSRIDPRSGRVLAIDVGGDPVKLAYGAGSVWVADGTGRTVIQVDAASGRVVQRIATGGGPRSVVFGGGAVWVAAALDGTVQRIDLRRGRVTQTIPLSTAPTDLAYGAGGLWVTSETGGNVVRIDPGSGRVLDAVNVGNGPGAVSIGAGGVWVANRQDGTVSRIDPRTASVAETIAVGRGPVAVAASGPLVWTANAEDGTISRIDARSGRVSDTIEIGSTPAAALPFDGGLWTATLPARESHRGGTLRVRTRTPDICGCADPIGYDGAVWPLISVAYDGLLGYRRTAGAAGGTLVGALAAGVPRPTDDGRTYVFRLRPGLRYSNGTPLRGGDVRASLERLLQVQSGVRGGYSLPDYFSALPGARACVRGEVPCDLSRAIDVDERARVVTFHLLRPDSEFLHKLALPLSAILPANTPRHFITGVPPPGTGPYRVVAFDAAHGARLERNPYFRDELPAYRPDGFPDVITATFSPPDQERDIADVEHGRVDVVTLQPGYDPRAAGRIRGLLTRHAGRLVPGDALSTDYMFMNVHEPPFDDARVRRAVNYATDRRRVAELAGGPEKARPTCQLLPPGMPGYKPFCPWTQDPSPGGEWRAPDLARAHRLIAASGTQGQRVVVWGPRPYLALARYFGGLMRQLGYRTAVRSAPSFPAYFPIVGDSRRHVQMGTFGWQADYVAPSNMVAPEFTCAALVPRSPSNANASQFCDPRVDEMIKRALSRSAADSAATASLWHAVDRRLVADAPAVPLTNGGTAVLVANRVGNVQQHPFWGALLEQLWVR